MLFGGESPEHEVSCVSAQAVVANADPERYEVDLLAITKGGDWVRPDIEAALSGEPLVAGGEPVDAFATMRETGQAGGVIFPALHGPKGEDGTVQGLFDLAGVAYVGCGVLASAVCMDKVSTKLTLASAGLPVVRHRVVTADSEGFTLVPAETNAPESVIASQGLAEGVTKGSGSPTRKADNSQPRKDTSKAKDAEQTISEVTADLGLPVFVKPANMGSSIGVSKAASIEEAAEAMEEAARYDRVVLVEETIDGREIECSLLGNHQGTPLRASVPGEIVPGDDFYTYADKYKNNQALLIVPAPLDETETAEFQEMSISAGEVLGIDGLARVDFLYNPARGPFINEVNTMPGFTPISLYPMTWKESGISYPDLVDELVRLALERHRSRQQLLTHPDESHRLG